MTILAGVDIPFTNNKQLANQAIEQAAQALTSANGKSKNYYQAETPTDPKENDLWFKTTASGITTNFYQYIDGGWKENFTTLSALSADLGTVVAGTLRAVLIEGSEIIGSIIRSADEGTEFYVEGGNMVLSRTNGRKVTINPDGLYGLNGAGEILFKADRGLVTSAALGTSNSNVYLAADSINEARVVDIKSIPSDGAAENYTYRPIRALGYKFGPGANGYLGMDGELRITSIGFTQEDGSVVYRNARANGLYANFLEVHGENTKNIYLRPDVDGEVQVTVKGTTDSFNDVRARWFAGTRFRLSGSYSTSILHVQPAADGEVQITSRSDETVFRPIKSSEYRNGSSISYKTNIEGLEDVGLDVINKLQLKKYILQSDVDNGIYDNWQVGLISELSPEVATPDGDAINIYKLLSYDVKATQELSTENTILKQRASDLEIVVGELSAENETLQQQLTNFAALTESLTSHLAELEERIALLEAK